MTTPDRLALKRLPDKSFVLFGAVVSDTKSDVTLSMPDGSTASHPKAGLLFVSVGSLNHFARLDPAALQDAFEAEPRGVFEQALIDSSKPLAVSDLKRKLVDAGLPAASVDKSWNALKKEIEGSPDVRVSGEGAARKLAWSGNPATRLAAFVRHELPTTAAAHEVDASGHGDDGVSATEPGGPAQVDHENSEIAAMATGPRAADHGPEELTEAQDAVDPEGASRAGLIPALSRLLGADAPASMTDLIRSTLRVGAALSSVSGSDLKALAVAAESEEQLLDVLLLVRERLIQSRQGARPQSLPPDVASAALESAVGEATRVPRVQVHFPRFAARVVQRTALDELPLALIARVFVRAASCEDASSDPSRHLLDLASALADRVKTSVGQEWSSADSAIADIARGMNRLPVDSDGPRTRFLAGLYEIRRQHLDGELLWRNVDMHALDQGAGGALRRALLDPDLAERIVKPEVLKFAAECRTRHGLGQLIALRGSFAQYLDERTIAEAMSRVAKEDRKAQEWYEGLRQQSQLEDSMRQRDDARLAADQARRAAGEAEQRAAKASADRDEAMAALHRASQSNALASDAQLRQAKLDVLKTLANLAVTIRSSVAAQEDPALLQRVGFALQREGLSETATTGETVKYDPVLHDAQGEHIDPGDAVSVGRPGYTYDSGDEELVLVKAHVSAI